MNREKIGKYIYECRKVKNLTQEQLAEKLGVTSKSISRWEQGRTMPDVSLFETLCEEVDISINDLLNGKKQNRKERCVNEPKSNRKVSATEIILLVLGSPIWISLFIVLIVFILSAYIVIWSAIISLWACLAAVIVVSLYVLIYSLVMFICVNVLRGIVFLGCTFILAGLIVFMKYGCICFTKCVIALTTYLCKLIKYKLFKKEVQ